MPITRCGGHLAKKKVLQETFLSLQNCYNNYQQNIKIELFGFPF